MSFRKAVSRMDAACFKRLGDGKAILDGKHLVSVKIDLDVEQFGAFDTTVPARRHEVSFLVCEIPNPKRGQTIQTEQGTFILDGSISNDGYVARWHINER
jgi:hypothetical protein